jgi:hypothetical protein
VQEAVKHYEDNPNPTDSFTYYGQEDWENEEVSEESE